MLSKILLIAAILGLSSALDTSDYLQDIGSSLLGSGDDDTSMEETGRFGFLTIDTNGIVLTFNTTSILNGLLTALAIGAALATAAAIAAAIAVPIAVGLGLKKHFYGGDEDYSDYSGSGSGSGSGGGYQSTGGSSYTDYAKRSLEVMSPVMKALYSAYNKYNGKEEQNVAL